MVPIEAVLSQFGEHLVTASENQLKAAEAGQNVADRMAQVVANLESLLALTANVIERADIIHSHCQQLAGQLELVVDRLEYLARHDANGTAGGN